MMQESERILAAERAPREILLILVELVEAGVPFDVAERALEMARRPARLREALDLCLDAIPDLDAALLASAEAVVLLCEATARDRRHEMANLNPPDPPQESALARDPFPLLEEARDPRDLPTVEEWLRAGAPMREIPGESE